MAIKNDFLMDNGILAAMDTLPYSYFNKDDTFIESQSDRF